MAMLSSYTTLLSLAPPLAPTPAKSSPAGAAAVPPLRSRQQAVSASASVAVAPLRWASRNQESRSRAALFACHAQNKYSYNIEPSALAYPATDTSNGTNWKITQETDVIVLELEVGESMTKDKLEVATADHVLLVVRYKGHINDEWRASSLDVRLLMPPGNDDKNVKAIMSNGWLKITIPKPKHELDDITIS